MNRAIDYFYMLSISLKIVLFFSISFLFSFFFAHKAGLAILVAPPLSLLGIYWIERWIKTKSPFCYLYSFIIILSGVIIEFIASNGIGFLPSSFFIVLSFILPFLFYYFSIIRKNKTSQLFIVVVYFANVILFNAYSEEIDQRYTYGNDSSWQAKNIFLKKVTVLNKDSLIQTYHIPNGIVVIDFWSRGCPQCIRDMPVVDSFQKKHSRILVVSLLVKHLKNHNKEMELLKEYAHRSNSYLLLNKEELKPIEIEGYPDYYILQDHRVIYRGNFNMIQKFFEERSLK